MDILQNLDIGSLLFISIGCVLLCVLGLVLMFGLQLIGTTVSTIVGVMELFSSIVGGGPIAWCGCAVLLMLCFGVVVIALLSVSCATNPSSMNFCLLFPR